MPVLFLGGRHGCRLTNGAACFVACLCKFFPLIYLNERFSFASGCMYYQDQRSLELVFFKVWGLYPTKVGQRMDEWSKREGIPAIERHLCLFVCLFLVGV